MKKLILIIILLLCGCSKSLVETTVDNVNDTKLWSATESVKGYAKAINVSYFNYLASSYIDDDYKGNTKVIINGDVFYLDVSYSGESVSCDSIVISSGNVSMNDCFCLGFTFDYTDKQVIKK